MKRKMITAALIAAAAIPLVPAPTASADPGCRTDLWGFLASQRRLICDGPIQPDGSWKRVRVIYTPAHRVPVSCGRYSCWGGYWVDQSIWSQESYPVRPETVLPDEPPHIDGI
ncbi:hypothetical protein SEA_TYPHA_103 [Mycobacterium phage Typha]|uniref:CDGP domain-containing protein n=1 Tax=Mycobacterium phage Typha TaxID=2517971 RepID=A0A482JAL9_9CAUD|nr:hypothetical protein KCH40_gp066 [Mycobacterium phage Typha]QBP29758.1 hypothetical protein SEA_TYPHA_103 [Mycobacterium phage Typha]URM86545.1 hypothetical protein PBI_HILLTOPFARM_107 [Mycobacterium phage Hilltopfarm]